MMQDATVFLAAPDSISGSTWQKVSGSYYRKSFACSNVCPDYPLPIIRSELSLLCVPLYSLWSVAFVSGVCVRAGCEELSMSFRIRIWIFLGLEFERGAGKKRTTSSALCRPLALALFHAFESVSYNRILGCCLPYYYDYLQSVSICVIILKRRNHIPMRKYSVE